MMKARLHRMNYTYNGPNTFYGLTYPEIKEAIHGDNLLEEAKHSSDDSKRKTSGGRVGNQPTEQERRAMAKFKKKHDLGE